MLFAMVGLIPQATVSVPSTPVSSWPKLPADLQFSQVTAVATDSKDRVYVFHRGPKPVLVFSADGEFLRSFGEGLIKTAHGLRIDCKDNVWITDIGSHLVIQFDGQGKVLRTLGVKNEPGADPKHFNKPADVAFGTGGEFYVADGYGNSRIVKFSRDGKYVKEWGTKGKGAGEFDLPHAVCVDDRGRVFVGDRENNRVQVFDAEGMFLAQWTQTGAPFGLFLLKDGRMLLADGRANLAKVLNAQGLSEETWGEKGSALGQFRMPHALCMDSTGAVYVAEVDGKRVQKFANK